MKKTTDNKVTFYCLGCKEHHAVSVVEGERPGWSFNQDFEKPTLSPSILVTYRHPKGYSNYNPAPLGYDGEYVEERCHSFVREGKIEYLSDCTHSLAGQTIDLPNLDKIYTLDTEHIDKAGETVDDMDLEKFMDKSAPKATQPKIHIGGSTCVSCEG